MRFITSVPLLPCPLRFSLMQPNCVAHKYAVNSHAKQTNKKVSTEQQILTENV